MAFAETAPLIATLDLKGNFASQLKRNQGALSSFSGSLGRAGRGTGQIASGFARVGTILGTVVAGGLVGAAKAAIDFEDAFAGVRKTVDEADLKAAGMTFESLALDFRKMATEIPIAATEFARIGEAAGALGVKAEDIDDFTKTVALLGVTTNLSTDQAAESLGKLGTILDLTGKEYNDFADVLVNLGNQGASTESEIIEITKRFAGAGRLAGLAVTDILALSSAIASLGVNQEAAGTALSRIFTNLGTEIANDSKKGQALSEVIAGVFDDLRKADAAGGGSHILGDFDKQADATQKRLLGLVDERKGLPILLEFLQGLNKLGPADQLRALKDVGIRNVNDRNAIIVMAQNLPFVNEQLKIATESTGALSEEAQKRFNTIASKLTLLKNNFTEAAITIGEGFLPALGRATEKLIAFLKVDANKSALTNIGKDIGKALDEINWADVLSGVQRLATLLQGALGIAKTLYDSFMLLPGPVKEAAAGFLVLNKLSGGLIGAGGANIISGLVAAITRAGASKLPIVGSLFAQPVFVTNWAMIGTAGGLSSLVKAGGLAVSLTAASLAALAVAIAVGVRGDSPTSGDPNQLPTPANTDRRIFELDRRIEALRRQDPNARAFPGSTTNMSTVAQEIAKLTAQLKLLQSGGGIFGPPTPRGWENRGPEVFGPPAPGTSGGRELRSTFSIDAAIQRGLAAGFKPTRAAAEATVQRNLERLAAANLAATNRVRDAADRGAGAALVTAAAVQNMDRKPPTTNVRVEVNVTAAQVAKTIVIQKRYGPPNGSRGAMPGDSGV